MVDLEQHLKNLRAQLTALDQQRAELVEEIAQSELAQRASDNKLTSNGRLTAEQRIDIFMDLFKGRVDLYPKRWQSVKTKHHGYSPVCANEWKKGICNKPDIKCHECQHRLLQPLTRAVVHKHLAGVADDPKNKDHTIGVYPLLTSHECWFLAVDFDKGDWQQDSQAFRATCEKHQVPSYLERSRSGKGGHVWIFFSEPVAAIEARKMGMGLLTETMEHYPQLSFESYDRLFPNQDFLPKGGFGNLIALPLQHYPRLEGNSVFIDESFDPYPDQWQYLSQVVKIDAQKVRHLVEMFSSRGKLITIPMPSTEDELSGKPWEVTTTDRQLELAAGQKMPEVLTMTLSNQLYIDTAQLPAALISRLKRLAAFQNPEFYKAQAMRFSTHNKPRIISCAQDFPEYLGLPRGCLEPCLALFESLSIQVAIEDRRKQDKKIRVDFLGELTDQQQQASEAMLQHDTGVLSATTGFGKTVIAAKLIASRKVNTLIIVHRKQLLEQWLERLRTFLKIDAEKIGVMMGGKYKPCGMIDIALMQSLVKKGEVKDVVRDYGQVIVDECHHLCAFNFETLVRTCQAKYVLGLTATPIRKDGHQPIIFMQCGPIRHQISAKQQAKQRSFSQHVIERTTPFKVEDAESFNITQLYQFMIEDAARNQLIINDVLAALEANRVPLVLTERKAHAQYLSQELARHYPNVVLMTGGANKNQCAALPSEQGNCEKRVIVATGRYIGEGFDDAHLDTLFLAMPISWVGTLAQYTGRLHRECYGKKDVKIYDYVDIEVRMLKNMLQKRRRGYRQLGYEIMEGSIESVGR